MSVLENLEPKEVFHYFEELTKIPRPSYHEEQVAQYLLDFAEEQGLEHWSDEQHNVIIIREAAPGYEEEPPVIIQGHMDMVCEKVEGLDKDMNKEGLDVATDGEFVYAKGTSLGGDDGIAVAYALALLSDRELQAPRIEFVCTVAEEVGMDGARDIDISNLKGKRLLNIDSEEEGVFLAGCAGGSSAKLALPVEWEKKSGVKLTITIDGLTGGHSGVEIVKQGANANILFGRLLATALDEGNVSLAKYRGGTKENAIPRRGQGVLLVDKEDLEYVLEGLEKEISSIQQEYRMTDPDLAIQIEKGSIGSETVLDSDSMNAVVSLLVSLPNGVQRMSTEAIDKPETSLNLGICKLSNQGLYLQYSVRSSIGSAREELERRIRVIATAFGAEVNYSGSYPAWEYCPDSKLRDKMVHIYEKMFGETPKVDIIHAGLECGLLSDKIEGLDCISMGPNIYGIHTTEERLDIASTKRMYEFVRAVLQEKD